MIKLDRTLNLSPVLGIENKNQSNYNCDKVEIIS